VRTQDLVDQPSTRSPATTAMRKCNMQHAAASMPRGCRATDKCKMPRATCSAQAWKMQDAAHSRHQQTTQTRDTRHPVSTALSRCTGGITALITACHFFDWSENAFRSLCIASCRRGARHHSEAANDISLKGHMTFTVAARLSIRFCSFAQLSCSALACADAC
jgi:hypothetical protein